MLISLFYLFYYYFHLMSITVILHLYYNIITNITNSINIITNLPIKINYFYELFRFCCTCNSFFIKTCSKFIKELTFKTSTLTQTNFSILSKYFVALGLIFLSATFYNLSIIYINTFICALSVTFVYFFKIFINISK